MAIASFRHKGLRDLYVSGASARAGAGLRKPAILILDHLAGASEIADLQGVRKFHALRGGRTGQYAMRVPGNWRIVFAWRNNAAHDADLEDCH